MLGEVIRSQPLAYRFEAYTPPAKRNLGYYAMPLLWRDDVIAWVKCLNSTTRT